MSEKTEDPTPKRLRDQRKKGQVAQSKEVASTALIVSIFAFLAIMSGFYYEKIEEMILLPATQLGPDFDFGSALNVVIDQMLSIMFQLLLPLIGLVIVIAIGSHFAQYGVLFAPTTLKPDLKKLNPAQGIKKIFSMKNLFELLKSILKIAFLSVLIYLVIRDALPDLMKLPSCGLNCVLPVTGQMVWNLALYSTFAFVIIAAADFAFQKFQFIKQNKMTKDEVKREYKESEGSPEIKGKRKQFHQELMQDSVSDGVKNSDVVVKNPTHYAVALEYKKDVTPLPIVRAKGENLLAKRIINIALENDIPVMENVPLAQALHSDAELDQYIPSDLVKPVAEVLRWVQQLENERELPPE